MNEVSEEIIKTPRWFDFPEIVNKHPEIQRWKQCLINKNPLNQTIAAGRRSYKTEILKRWMITESIFNSNEQNFLGAPTRQQAKEIFWKDIKDLSHPVFVKKMSEVELKIEYIGGSSLRVVGLKEFKRVQGGLAHRVGVTEYQECEPGVYNESFEPMLIDTGGIWIGEGRPLGKNHFFDDYQRGVNNEKDWGSFHWKAKEILSSEQIEKAQRDLAKEDYAREYDASFETLTGQPYYAYSSLSNLKFEYNPEQPLIVACDFNATVKPMSWNIGQRQLKNNKPIVHWGKTLSFTYTNTELMCGILDDYFKTLSRYPQMIIFYGDYAGKQQKSNSSESDWQIIEKYFRNKARFETRLKQCRSIRDSIAATNAQLCNTLGERKQFIDYENCKALVLDWEKCDWADNSKELKDNDDLRGHCCRAVDYFNDYEFPIQGKPTSEWRRL